MDDKRRTQKQISQRYQGALGYYGRVHAWRLLRFAASAVAIIGGIAAILIYQRRGPEKFFSVGPISAVHTSFGEDCSKCHVGTYSSHESLSLPQIAELLQNRFQHGIPLGPLDAQCQTCHTQHTLHQPNVAQNRSCSVCHQEHKGSTSLRMIASNECAACHNDAHIMQASAQKGAQLPASAFQLHRLRTTQISFEPPRPTSGYTQTFASFWSGHPEFQLKREQARDPDVLRFNHRRHLADDIPSLNGQRLSCVSCHKPDDEGRYVKRVTFTANCQACHSLQFDPNNPELMLPHGDPNAVRAFLQTLPTQYAQLAAKRGLTRPNEIQSFVVQQLVRLRQAHHTTDDLERDIFFTTNPYKPQITAPNQPRGLFYGCAVCHEVKPNPGTAPLITRPVIIDRWLSHARFDHAKHAAVDCITCHRANQSSNTSDVLMPGIASCVTCHSPQGKVVAECVTCHTYHAPPQIAANQAVNANVSLRQLLLQARGSRP